jgi:hypothetical protein
MANAVKGEVAVACGEKTYTLVLTTNALCELEDLLGQSTGKSIRQLSEMDMRVMRGMFWAALRRHHQALTVQGAADIIDALGAAKAIKALDTAVERAMKPLEEDRPLDGSAIRTSPGIGSAPSATGSPAV